MTILSDSMTQATWNKVQGKTKKLKKKNRISQIIAGVAYKSKSELFQKLFKDMTSDEQLVLDYSCALHRDILVHGRLYLSQNWLCFYANIFGWETLVTIQWTDITAVTKEKTVKLIPNAIKISTNTEKYFFTTFVTRETAFTGLFRIWQNALLGHPMNPAELKAVCRKFRQKKQQQQQQHQQQKDTIDGDPSLPDDHDETGDEVVEEDDLLKSTETTSESMDNTSKLEAQILEGSNTESLSTEPDKMTPPPTPSDVQNEPHPVSTAVTVNDKSVPVVKTTQVPVPPQVKINNEEERKTANHSTNSHTQNHTHEHNQKNKHKNHVKHNSPFHDILHFGKRKKIQRAKYPSYHLSIPDHEGETTTDYEEESDEDVVEDIDVLCPCHDSHAGKEYVSEEFNFDVDALFEHLFAQESDTMKRVFAARNFTNWKYTPLEKQGEGDFIQSLRYTLPLNYSIGPSQSDTTSTQTISKENKPGQFYLIEAKNTSAGIPYSDSFYVVVKYCITRVAGNRSRLKVHGEVKYIKKVFGFVKNMISRTADEALRDYFVYLISLLRSASELVPGGTIEIKRRKKNKKLIKGSSKDFKSTLESSTTKASSTVVATVEKPVTTIQDVNESYMHTLQTSPAIFFIFVFLLFTLFSTNVYLYRRLNTLEGSIVINTRRHKWLPDELPRTKDEWTNLLEFQQGLHELEILKLKQVIGTTGVLVKQVETSVRTLYEELDKSYDQKLVHVKGQRQSREDL